MKFAYISPFSREPKPEKLNPSPPNRVSVRELLFTLITSGTFDNPGGNGVLNFMFEGDELAHRRYLKNLNADIARDSELSRLEAIKNGSWTTLPTHRIFDWTIDVPELSAKNDPPVKIITEEVVEPINPDHAGVSDQEFRIAGNGIA